MDYCVNDPGLVLRILDGKLSLGGYIATESDKKDFRVEFKQSSKDCDGYTAGIFSDGKPIARKSRRIPIDFDILSGLYDMLFLLAAFAAPENDVFFQVSEIGEPSAILSTYRVYYAGEGEKLRREIEKI